VVQCSLYSWEGEETRGDTNVEGNFFRSLTFICLLAVDIKVYCCTCSHTHGSTPLGE
jgi:hypothetical protein